MIAQALGGIGLFLIGMVLVTDGLRAAAGDSLRRVLLRFTGGPFKALLSGTVVTAVVQSSSATTVATIGFVSAGLLSFEQALGIMFGANIGTTATGWLVALFGLKFSVSVAALPMVGVGAFMKVIGRGRMAYFGLALAGFGLILLGIDVLQGGMAHLSETLTPAVLPDDTFGGRLLLVGIGVVLTAVMQSSSAAVATTLTALYGGAISLPQAAAMVIGVNIGTTVTAAIAVIGASTAAKQTAFAHVVFNVITGVVAFLLLPVFGWLSSSLNPSVSPADAALALAAFHTAFNMIGVAVMFPFTRPFAALVTRVIQRRGPQLTHLLDPGIVGQGDVATEAVRQTAIELTGEAYGALEVVLNEGHLSRHQADRLDAAITALRDTEKYLESLRFADPLSGAGQARHVSTVHALNHLGRLLEHTLSAHHVKQLDHQELKALTQRLRDGAAAFSAWAADPHSAPPIDSLHHLYDRIEGTRLKLRADLLAQTAAGTLSPATAARQLETLRWLGRIAYHSWRLADHLRGERRLEAPADVPEPAEVAE